MSSERASHRHRSQSRTVARSVVVAAVRVGQT
jgi:hypothetical protein